jgi:peptidoglycan/xylan/chitin deacetylase (PgdA/CDA1 family)
MRKQVLIILSVALASFLLGTTFSVVALNGENPFVKIWEAINNLQKKVETLDEPARTLRTLKRKMPTFSIVSNFAGGAGTEWTKKSVSGTIADDTTNFIAATQGIRMTSVDNEDCEMEEDVTTLDMDTVDKYFFIRVYIDNYAKLDTMKLKAGDDDWSDYFECNLRTLIAPATANYAGWQEATVLRIHFSTGAGSPNWTAIERIRVQVKSTASTTVNVTFDTLQAVTNMFTKGVIVLRFDDLEAEHATYAKRPMDAHGYRGVLAFVGSFVGRPGEMTLADCTRMRDQGWEFINHLWSHGGYQYRIMDGSDAAAILEEINHNRDYMAAQGLTNGCDIVSPGGRRYNGTAYEVMRQSCLAMLTSGEGASKPLTNLAPGFQALMTAAYDTPYNFTTLRRLVDDCETSKNVLVLIFHRFASEEESTFNSFLTYIAGKNVDVNTLTEVLE